MSRNRKMLEPKPFPKPNAASVMAGGGVIVTPVPQFRQTPEPAVPPRRWPAAKVRT